MALCGRKNETNYMTDFVDYGQVFIFAMYLDYQTELNFFTLEK